MKTVTSEDLSRLLGGQQPPCVSIYLPTERAYPERQQEPIRYGNLVDRAEEAQRRKYPTAEGRAVLDRLRTLIDDGTFWRQGPGGLAVLASPSTFDTFWLRNSPPERAVVGDAFLLTPLLRVAQSADRFHVLCLQREAARLYEGNRDGLSPIEPPGVPLNVDDPLVDQAAGPQAERFFRAVDHALWERVSRPSGAPVVLVALPEHQTAFRALTKNPQFLGTGVEQSPAGLSDRELLPQAWECVEPTYLARLGRFAEDFNVARSRGQGTDDLAEAARAAHAGRVGILLVEADRTAPGRLDPDSGAVRSADDAEAGDLLSDLAGLVLRRDGAVVVVPGERMPTKTGLAAIYRF